jgi:hypothetical protein
MKKWVFSFLTFIRTVFSVFLRKRCTGCDQKLKRNPPVILVKTDEGFLDMYLCVTCAESLEHNIQLARNSYVRQRD